MTRATRFLRTMSLVSAAGLAATTIGISGGAASASTASSFILTKCSTNGRTLSVTVYYNSTGSDHHIYKIAWKLSGSIHGSNNDISVYIRRDIPNKVDTTYSSNHFPNKKKGSGSKSFGLYVPKSHKVYVSIGATFEKPNAIDPVCSKTSLRF